jgi:hypothetical protein
MNRIAAVKEALNNGYVSTPGGFRKRSAVHIAQPGEGVVLRGGVSHLMGMTSAVISDASSAQPAEVNPGNDTAGGWVAWAEWSNNTGTAITSVATTWVVPPPPSQAGSRLIYLFNALENPAGDEILQPVLQWGTSGAGGGNFWSVASWHVDAKGHAYCTPSIPVSPGDVLVGLMTQVAVFTDGTRNYRCEFQGLQGTSLMALGMVEFTLATQTLEAYGVAALAEYPAAASTVMGQIDLRLNGAAAPLRWDPQTEKNPAFGERADVVSNANPGGSVSLSY